MMAAFGLELARRLKAVRLVIIVSAVVLGALVVAGDLSPAGALLAWGALAGAALLGVGPAGTSAPPIPTPPPVPDDPPLAVVIDAIPAPVILLDPDGLVVAFNIRAAGVYPALRRADPISFALRVPEVIEAIAEVSDAGAHRRVEFSDRGSAERWFEAHVAPLAWQGAGTADPRPAAVAVVLHEFTQQRRVEQMRVDFVANASHELRTPLASVLGFIETLQGPARNDPAARERFLEIMRRQANRMARLIDHLLSLSRIELKAHVRPSTPVDLVPIVGHVVDTLGPLARERSVELLVNRRADALVVLGDRDELIRVVENLVENALKYGASGGRVEIDVARASDGDVPEAMIAVRDFGPGIAPEHLPRLTERFYRVDAGASREQGGTGLGLAIVKHIIARHRARLLIDSRLGEGATFVVRIDLLSADSAQAKFIGSAS